MQVPNGFSRWYMITTTRGSRYVKRCVIVVTVQCWRREKCPRWLEHYVYTIPLMSYAILQPFSDTATIMKQETIRNLTLYFNLPSWTTRRCYDKWYEHMMNLNYYYWMSKGPRGFPQVNQLRYSLVFLNAVSRYTHV